MRKVVEMLKEANQEAKREVWNDRQTYCNCRELHISNVSNKNIGKRIDSIIAQNVECYRGCNWP